MKSDHLAVATAASQFPWFIWVLVNKNGTVWKEPWVEGFTQRLPGSPSVMAPLQTKESGVPLENQETRASLRQTHATSKITMGSSDSDQSSLDWLEVCWHWGTLWGGLRYQERVDCKPPPTPLPPKKNKIKQNPGGIGLTEPMVKVMRSDRFRELSGLCVS